MNTVQNAFGVCMLNHRKTRRRESKSVNCLKIFDESFPCAEPKYAEGTVGVARDISRKPIGTEKQV